MKTPLGAATVVPNCVVVANVLLVPVYHNFAFEISVRGKVVPVVFKEKLVAFRGEEQPEVTICMPMTSLFVVLTPTTEVLFCVTVLEEYVIAEAKVKVNSVVARYPLLYSRQYCAVMQGIEKVFIPFASVTPETVACVVQVMSSGLD